MKQSQSEKAYEIAKRAHLGQIDKAGEDYIKHPEKVASFVNSDEEKAVAYLHDVIEDTELTLEDLREYGFSEEVLKDQDPNEVDPFNKNFVFDLIIDMAYSNLDSLKMMETASSIKLIFEGNEKELELIKDTLGEMVIGKDSNLFKDTEDYLKTCLQYYTDQLRKLTYDMINDDLIVFDYSNYPNLGNPTVTACEKHSHECNCGHCEHDHH